MSHKFSAIADEHKAFIEDQEIFFVATSAPDCRLNLSPKGGDSFRVVDANRVVWLNITGSGNETAAHLPINPQMTVMFCSFGSTPLILRLYGQARVYHPRDKGWEQWSGLLPSHMGARQIIEMEVDLVQTSCGFGVPRYEFLERRATLDKWAEKQGAEGVQAYWQEKNQKSIDGLPTHILGGQE